MLRRVVFGRSFPNLLSELLVVFPSRFVSWPVVLRQKKTPVGVVRDQTGVGLKTHDSRHRGEIGVQVCIEGGIVVVDGAIRIL